VSVQKGGGGYNEINISFLIRVKMLLYRVDIDSVRCSRRGGPWHWGSGGQERRTLRIPMPDRDRERDREIESQEGGREGGRD
jgi:hypothetical protein